LSFDGARSPSREAPLTIVVPVYNEGSNFPKLWDSLASSIRSPFSAVVVYDFDEDDTVPVVNELISQGEKRVRAIRNAYGRGVVGAIRTGFDVVPQGPILVVMADLSDDLRVVDRMLALYREGYDIVVGSRYMPGGQINGGPLIKKTLSRLAGTSLYYLRGVPTHDATNAFKIYDAEMLHSFNIESQGGFELNLELTVKAFLNHHRIVEVPSVWNDRTEGTSRFRLWKWLPSYLRWYLLAYSSRSSAEQIKSTS
jgi:glycosyltransferase involved in cell wall biosynthesis